MEYDLARDANAEPATPFQLPADRGAESVQLSDYRGRVAPSPQGDLGVRDGGPDAVIEVRSPEDETYEKLPFYEAIVIDRDTKRLEIYRLAGSQFVALQPDADGWLHAETMNVRFRLDAGKSILRIKGVRRG